MSDDDETTATLQTRAISRFDSLQAQGRLFFEETEPALVDSSGYKLQFRKIPAFDEKPLPERPGKPKGNPFLEALEEDFVVSRIASTHVLQLNKFCVYRPHLILHTRDFAPQTDPLDLSDFQASWEVLSQLDDPYVAFYNCGLDAGSSQPHKHLQLIPYPPKDEFSLFPDIDSRVTHDSTKTNDRSEQLLKFSQPSPSAHVPFYSLVSYITEETNPKALYNVYQQMLGSPHPDYPDLIAHNVVLTKNWICVIPRRRRLVLQVPANAMGMMGLIWVGTWAERVGWTLMGKSWHLETLGAPPLPDL